jgi:hypothetical protein
MRREVVEYNRRGEVVEYSSLDEKRVSGIQQLP